MLISCENHAYNGCDTSKYLENREVFISDGFKYKVITIEGEKFLAYQIASGNWEVTQIINTNDLCNNKNKNYENNNSSY